MLFDTVCIVGVGLIGGSFGLAVKERGLARQVIGAVRRPATINEAFQRGAVDNATTHLAEAARGADFVFMSPPVGQMRELCKQLVPSVKAGAIITDAGSTKLDVVQQCTPLFGQKAHFIGGHPMAGSEKTGVAHARADLFEGAIWVLTPTAVTPSQVMEKMHKLVEALGARPLVLEAGLHDRLLAVTSHLPHITASALVHLFANAHDESEIAQQLVASGWRDATRVAAGSPDMWRDICLSNAKAVTQAIDELQSELRQLRDLIQNEDAEGVHHWFDSASEVRRKQGYFPRNAS